MAYSPGPTQRCPRCGTALAESATFCNNCGTPLSAPSKPAASDPYGSPYGSAPSYESPRAASQTRKPRVFVSHSHRNNNITARLVADLQAAGAEVWVDMEDIQFGDFMRRINEGLKACDWLVVVLTPAALASRPIQMEVNVAINLTWQDKMQGVIPFMVEPCDHDQIPPTWQIQQYYDATSDYAKALAGLLRALGLRR